MNKAGITGALFPIFPTETMATMETLGTLEIPRKLGISRAGSVIDRKMV